jgi:conjugal transfer/type IV secretion protein DotA/TraY
MPRILSTLRALLLVVSLSGLAGVALAQPDFTFAAPVDSAALAPKSTDVSGGILREILGRAVFGDHSGGYQNATLFNERIMGSAFMMFNSAMLIFGSIIFAYASIVGTIRTATDGEVLGKKWSSVWIPMRYSIGTILLFPTASGFSLAQMGVVWLAMQGAGFASVIWSHTLAVMSDGDGNIVAPDIVSPDVVRRTAANILRSEVCAADMNNTLGTPGAAPQFGLDPAWALWSYIPGASGAQSISFQWGPLSPNSGIDSDVCGSIVANTGTTFDSTGDITNTELRVMRQAQHRALKAAISEIRANNMPARIVQRASADADGHITIPAEADVRATEIVSAIDRATNAYLREMSSAANSLKRSYTRVNADFIRKSSEEGWMTAGQWYYQMARVSSDIATVMRYVGDYKPPRAKGLGEPGLDPALSAWLDTQFRSASRLSAATSTASSTSANVNVGGQGWPNGIGWGTKTAARLLGYDINNAAHPVVQLKNVGDYLMGTIESLYGAKAVASTAVDIMKPAGGLASVIGSGTKALVAESLWKNFMSPIFYVVMLSLVSLFIFGCMLSIYLPLAPFVIWIGAILGWLISIFEMMVAVPLWIAAQLHPEGEGMVAKWGANGYMILLEIIMRPALMVFGLLGAFVICEPFMRFLVSSFWNAAESVQSESVHGLPSLALVVAIFVTLGVTMINRLFSMIHVVPNTVMRWLGGMGSSHDRSEQDQASVYAAVSKVGGNTQAALSGAGSMISRRTAANAVHAAGSGSGPHEPPAPPEPRGPGFTGHREQGPI